nr:unnamed protein product [Digitaria exilis]
MTVTVLVCELYDDGERRMTMTRIQRSGGENGHRQALRARDATAGGGQAAPGHRVADAVATCHQPAGLGGEQRRRRLRMEPCVLPWANDYTARAQHPRGVGLGDLRSRSRAVGAHHATCYGADRAGAAALTAFAAAPGCMLSAPEQCCAAAFLTLSPPLLSLPPQPFTGLPERPCLRREALADGDQVPPPPVAAAVLVAMILAYRVVVVVLPAPLVLRSRHRRACESERETTARKITSELTEHTTMSSTRRARQGVAVAFLQASMAVNKQKVSVDGSEGDEFVET